MHVLEWMLAAGLAVQAQAITGQNVDAYLAEKVAAMQADVGRDDFGLTLQSATLQGRTITVQWRQADELTAGMMDMIEQTRLAACDDADVQALLALGVVERNINLDSNGLRFQFDLSARACEGDRLHTSDRWRTASISRRAAVAVDAASVAADGPRRRFLAALVSAKPLEPDEAFRKGVYLADCETRTFARQSVVLYDEDAQPLDEDDSPLAAEPAGSSSPMEAALKGVCSDVWSDPSERDLKAFLALADETLERPAED